MKKKKVIIFGGGNAMSNLLKGLKNNNFNITAVVTVSDDGNSTGRLRKEFNIPAVGDLRRVIVSLSNSDEHLEKLLNYRFNTSSDLDGHTVGNLLLTASFNISNNLSSGIESLSKVLNLKGKVLPLTEDNTTLIAQLDNNQKIIGESNITKARKNIKSIYYKNKPKVKKEVLKEIKTKDIIIISSGSLYTSIIPHLLCKEIIDTIDSTNIPIVYICNLMTQPGETDKFKVSDHIKTINNYLGKRKIDVVFVNNGTINKKIIKKYLTSEQKDQVILDKENINTNIFENDYIKIIEEKIVHNSDLIAKDIYNYFNI